MATLTNVPYDALAIGQRSELRRTATVDDFTVFANASGNHNPMHLAAYDGDGDGVPEAVAPALWLASLVSAVLGNRLPGPGTQYLSQTLAFPGTAVEGDDLIIAVEVLEKAAARAVRLATTVNHADGPAVLTGEAWVRAPATALTFKDLSVPGLIVERHRHFEALIAKAEALPPLPTAVVAPEDDHALAGALLAHRHRIITPLLVGAPARIAAAARAIEAPLEGFEIVDAPTPEAAAETAVALVEAGRAHAIMKGHLQTRTLLRACLRKEGGLRTGRRFTHVFVMDVPGLPYPLLVSDAAINIAPDLLTRVDIVQNAIDVARAIGIETPKVGVLSAVETVNPKIPSSVDAALVAKMAERGQITGGLVDGPLAMDNAVDLTAARTKGLRSQVAGRADILIVPNLDAGNMLAKQLIYVSHAEGAGLVVGARVPIILNSRADHDTARLASCAVAALHHQWVRR
ncbi:MAG: bifunctional enoyl-CoA hydratase/phosphate acetyltransferase [Pseudomonadota bacterium]